MYPCCKAWEDLWKSDFFHAHVCGAAGHGGSPHAMMLGQSGCGGVGEYLEAIATFRWLAKTKL